MEGYPKWGRVPKTKQQALPFEAKDRCGGIRKWSRHPAWTPAMRAALSRIRKGSGKWHTLIGRMYDPRLIEAAWQRLDRRTSGPKRCRGAGVDGVTVEQFSRRAEGEIPRLAQELRSGSYRPRPVRRHEIPKPGSRKKRPLGIPCVRDKVAQEALRSLIEPVFEAEFLEGSHGFRPERSTETACRHLEAYLEAGFHWVVDADVRNCFGEIDHGKQLESVNARIADGKVLKLIRSFLKSGVMEEMVYRETVSGTPQGGVISPLLCNIFLHHLDLRCEEKGLGWVRYADDFLLLCRTREEAEAALQWVTGVLTEMGLSLSPEKTCVTCLQDGFDFLGWHYKGDQRWPRTKSEKALRIRLREKTRRLRPGSMEQICAEVSLTLRGWYTHFRDGNSLSTFSKLEKWLRRRLRAILHRRRKRKGMGSLGLNFRWPNARFRSWGLFEPSVELRRYRQRCAQSL